MNLLSLYLIITIFMGNPGEKQAVALWGSFLHRASAPATRASPNITITIRRLMKNPDKSGGKGMLPACCLPLWGERGSPSWLPQRISELHKKKRISTKPKNQITSFSIFS
jgi:hypothetical protein